MKKLILSLVAIATISLSSFGQAPEGFKYQAVLRDAGNLILNNQAVGMQMTIQQGGIGGSTVYQETFAPTTNGYGLVNLEIGSGTVVIGIFATIDWSAGPYFIETAIDVTGGTSYAVMGTSQLMSVPYALYAKTAENVTNDLIDDADADPNNELQDWSNLPGIPANIDIDATDDFSGDYNDLTNQPTIPTLTSELTNNSGFISSPNDADSDPSNEIQTLSVSGNNLTLSNTGGTVAIPAPVLNNLGGRSGLCAGSTNAGAGWAVYDATTIRVVVNTSGCGFTGTPKYFTSIGGLGSHFELVGASAIYSPSANGFSIYIKKNDGSTLTPADAANGGWQINWQGIGN